MTTYWDSWSANRLAAIVATRTIAATGRASKSAARLSRVESERIGGGSVQQAADERCEVVTTDVRREHPWDRERVVARLDRDRLVHDCVLEAGGRDGRPRAVADVVPRDPEGVREAERNLARPRRDVVAAALHLRLELGLGLVAQVHVIARVCADVERGRYRKLPQLVDRHWPRRLGWLARSVASPVPEGRQRRLDLGGGTWLRQAVQLGASGFALLGRPRGPGPAIELEPLRPRPGTRQQALHLVPEEAAAGLDVPGGGEQRRRQPGCRDQRNPGRQVVDVAVVDRDRDPARPGFAAPDASGNVGNRDHVKTILEHPKLGRESLGIDAQAKWIRLSSRKAVVEQDEVHRRRPGSRNRRRGQTAVRRNPGPRRGGLTALGCRYAPVFGCSCC